VNLETKWLVALDALQRIRGQAQAHVEAQEPGWGRWATTLRLCDEALVNTEAIRPCQPGYEVTIDGLKVRCCLGQGHAGACVLSRVAA